MLENYNKTGKCCICNKNYSNWGNNALPIKDGRCCDECNNTIVIEARLKNLQQGKSVY